MAKYKPRSIIGIAVLAFLIAAAGYVIAQNAQDTADINNVFEIVVNNTNLAPSVAGHPPGTGERVSGTTYWANTTPIQVLVFAHAMAVGDNAEIHLFINGTKVADTSGRPLGGAETSNKTIIAMIPKGANYSFEFNNAHHYEWREYPVLSGKNGTLSINQSVFQSYNATYDATTTAFNSNYSSQTFPNSTINGTIIRNYTAHYKVGSFTRNTTVASGTQSITSIGFKPSEVDFIASGQPGNFFSTGYDDGVNSVVLANYTPSGKFYIITGLSIWAVNDSSNQYYAHVQSMDTDGFTLVWTKAGNPLLGTMTVGYNAKR